jgi:hypothetical protein
MAVNDPRNFNQSVTDGTNTRDVKKRASSLQDPFYGDGGPGLYGSQEPEVDTEKEEEAFAQTPEWMAWAMTPGRRSRFLEYLRTKESSSQEPQEPPILSKAADDKFFGNIDEMRKFTRKKL